MHSQPPENCPQAYIPNLKHCSVLQKRGKYTAMLSLLQKFFSIYVGYIQKLYTLLLLVQPYRLCYWTFSNYPVSVGTEGQQTILDKYFCHLVLDNQACQRVNSHDFIINLGMTRFSSAWSSWRAASGIGAEDEH